MKQLFSKFLVAFLLTSAVVLSWSEYFFQVECSFSITNQENVFRFCGFSHFFTKYVVVTFKLLFCPCCMTI